MKTFGFFWIRSTAVMQRIQARLITMYRYPLWQITVTEHTPAHLLTERGDYLLTAFPDVYNANDRVYPTQLCRIINLTRDLMNFTMNFELQEIQFT